MTASDSRDGSPTTTGGERPHDRVRAVAVAGGLTLAAVVVSALGGVAFVVPLLVYGVDVASTGVFLAVVVAGQLAFLAVAYAYHRRLRSLRIRVAVPTGREVGVIVAATVAALAVASVLSMALVVLELAPDSVIVDAGAARPTIYLGLAVLSVVLVAPAEEYLFRGVVQGRLRQSFGPVGAVVGSSLLFGSVHLANYAGSLPSVVTGALLVAATGTVLGAVYEYSGNLAVPVAVHATYNAVLLLTAYASLSATQG